MSYRLQVRLAAEAEAAEWYDQRQPGLGEKFVREVDQAIARVVKILSLSPSFISAMKCGVR